MRLSSEVTEFDVNEAVRLIRSALKQAATDARTGLIDMGLLTEGVGSGERRRRGDLKRSVVRVVEEMMGRGGGGGGGGNNGVRYAEVYRRLGEVVEGGGGGSVEGQEFADVVRSLEQEGLISVSGEGARRVVRRVAGA